MSKNNKPNNTGIITVIAVIAVIGFIAMTFAYLGKANSSATLGADTGANGAPADKVDITVTASDHVRGDSNAPVTIVEYSDYQCPYCAQFQTTMQTVMENYPGQVRWIFRHFPLTSLHPYALKAAEAAECAGEQGKYWEYSDQLYANQPEFSPDYFSTLAGEMNLDTGKFNDCVNSNRYAAVINSDSATGQKYGITGTPTFFVNGVRYKGAMTFTQIKPIIDNALNK